MPFSSVSLPKVSGSTNLAILVCLTTVFEELSALIETRESRGVDKDKHSQGGVGQTAASKRKSICLLYLKAEVKDSIGLYKKRKLLKNRDIVIHLEVCTQGGQTAALLGVQNQMRFWNVAPRADKNFHYLQNANQFD
jgi:hypothetical protein